jgi:hypothetical protein
VLRSHCPTAGIEPRKELLEQYRRTSCIGFGEGRTLGGPQTEGSKRVCLGRQRAYHIPQAVASRQLSEDQGAELALPAEHPTGASCAMYLLQRLDLRSRDQLKHLGQNCVTMGHGSNPPAGGMSSRSLHSTSSQGASSLFS